MIYLNSKADQNMHTHTGQAEKFSLRMSKGITSVSEENNCNIDATQERSNLKGWVEKFQGARKAVLGSLAAMTVMSGAACAQDAPKAQLVASNTATAPAKVTPAAEKVEAIDDEWDLGFGDELAAEKAETAKTAEQLAAEKAETTAEKAETQEATRRAEEATRRADIIEDFVKIAEKPDS